ncbi:MAG: hypothetical protein R3E66_11185 [bacterium]
MDDILKGVPAAVMPLIEDVHHAEWPAVLAALKAGSADAFVGRVFEQYGPKAFIELLRSVVGTQELPVVAKRDLRLNSYEAIAQAAVRLYGADDSRTLGIRVAVLEQTWTTYENPVVAASALFKRVVQNTPEHKAQVARILGHAYLMERHYDRALESYTQALADADAGLKGAIERRRIACFFYLGRYSDAREAAKDVLKVRGALFAGGDVVMSAPSPVEAACDELKSILDWCDATKPEWIRGLGVLAEAVDKQGAPSVSLWSWFESALTALEGRDHSHEDMEVVLRQLMERDAKKAALSPAKWIADHAGDDVRGQWARFNYGVLVAQSHGFEVAFEMQHTAAEALRALSPEDGSRAYMSHARMLLENGRAEEALSALEHVIETDETRSLIMLVRDCAKLELGDDNARASLMKGLDNLEKHDRLASPEGEFLVGVLVGDALQRGDAIALDIQKRFAEAVNDRFDGGPPSWMELVNLAGVHAQLGQMSEASAILHHVILAQEAAFGPRYDMALQTRAMLAEVLDSAGDAAGAAEQRAAIASAGAPMSWEPVKL